MEQLPMHEALKPVSWLEGTWRTEVPAFGYFPTIKSFRYHEEINFSSIGQPMFNYTAQTWHPETKKPMHREVGFLKIVPGTSKLCLIVSHNFSLTTIEEGDVRDNIINLRSTGISRPTVGTKQPAVLEVRREFKFDGNRLEQILYMSTETTQEITEHLRAVYVKQSEENK